MKDDNRYLWMLNDHELQRRINERQRAFDGARERLRACDRDVRRREGQLAFALTQHAPIDAIAKHRNILIARGLERGSYHEAMIAARKSLHAAVAERQRRWRWRIVESARAITIYDPSPYREEA